MPPRIPKPGTLTNIGTTTPPTRPLQGRPRVFIPGTGTALPIGLPVAQQEGEVPGAKAIAPDPLWISRWQNSATPIGQPRPWVVGYKWWIKGLVYQSVGQPLPYNQIDFKWRDYARGYINIPDDLLDKFKHWTDSVGQFFHQFILVPNWKPGMGARYPEVPA